MSSQGGAPAAADVKVIRLRLSEMLCDDLPGDPRPADLSLTQGKELLPSSDPAQGVHKWLPNASEAASAAAESTKDLV